MKPKATNKPSAWNTFQKLRDKEPNKVTGLAFTAADSIAIPGAFIGALTQGNWLRLISFSTGFATNVLFTMMKSDSSDDTIDTDVTIPKVEKKPKKSRKLLSAAYNVTYKCAQKIEQTIPPKLFQTLGITAAVVLGLLSGLNQEAIGQTLTSLPLIIAGHIEQFGNAALFLSIGSRLTHQVLEHKLKKKKVSDYKTASKKDKHLFKLHDLTTVMDWTTSNLGNVGFISMGALIMTHNVMHNFKGFNTNWMHFLGETINAGSLVATGLLFIVGATTLLKKQMGQVKYRVRHDYLKQKPNRSH